MVRLFLGQKIADMRFRAVACCYGNKPRTAAVHFGMKLRLGHSKNMRPESVSFQTVRLQTDPLAFVSGSAPVDRAGRRG